MLGNSDSNLWIYCNGWGSVSNLNLNFPTDVCQKSSPSSNSSERSSVDSFILSTSGPMIRDGLDTCAVAVAVPIDLWLKDWLKKWFGYLPTSVSDSVIERAIALTTFSDGIIAARSSCSETVSTVAVIIWGLMKILLSVRTKKNIRTTIENINRVRGLLNRFCLVSQSET